MLTGACSQRLWMRPPAVWIYWPKSRDMGWQLTGLCCLKANRTILICTAVKTYTRVSSRVIIIYFRSNIASTWCDLHALRAVSWTTIAPPSSCSRHLQSLCPPPPPSYNDIHHPFPSPFPSHPFTPPSLSNSQSSVNSAVLITSSFFTKY